MARSRLETRRWEESITIRSGARSRTRRLTPSISRREDRRNGFRVGNASARLTATNPSESRASVIALTRFAVAATAARHSVWHSFHIRAASHMPPMPITRGGAGCLVTTIVTLPVAGPMDSIRVSIVSRRHSSITTTVSVEADESSVDLGGAVGCQSLARVVVMQAV